MSREKAEKRDARNHLTAALEQSQHLRAQLEEAEQASREDRARLYQYQLHELAESGRQQETEREFNALEARYRDAVLQRNILFEQEARLQKSLSNRDAELMIARREKAELQESLNRNTKDLEIARRKQLEITKDLRKFNRFLEECAVRENDLIDKLDEERAKLREKQQEEQRYLEVAAALERQNKSQMELSDQKDLEIQVGGGRGSFPSLSLSLSLLLPICLSFCLCLCVCLYLSESPFLSFVVPIALALGHSPLP